MDFQNYGQNSVGVHMCIFFLHSPFFFFHQVLKSVHEAMLLLSTTYTPLPF